MEDWKSTALTAKQMSEVDRLAEQKYGLQLIQIMENAGRQLSSQALRMLGDNVEGNEIVVLCGPGNNGGGGMAAARHLHNWGARVSVILAAEASHLKPVPAEQWRTILALGLASQSNQIPRADLIVDALLGYNAKGDPRPPISTWIDQAASTASPILSLDLPSGLDANSGLPGAPCIKANATLTLAAPKVGIFAEAARLFVGDIYLADIGIPPQVYLDLFPNRELFSFGSEAPIKILNKTPAN